MITFLLFVLPCIKLLSGQKHQLLMRDAILGSKLKKRQGRAELQRGITYIKNKKLYVKSVGEQGSGILSSMNAANCLIYLSVGQGSCEVDSKVKVIKFKDYI